ncbi:MAG: hypothetical protein IJ299_02290 [Oscillospiraceae bacterium]|nr:hypothetical protein [Oscillospiraceae bacterium]
MKEIIRVIIKGASGYCSVDEAYTDKVAITSSSIAYEYIPEIESEINPKRKWTYKTNSPLFAHVFEAICKMMPEVLFADNIAECTDVGMFDFTVTYEDKTKKNVCYWCMGEEFEDLFKLIKQLVPDTEYVPAVLLTSDDE